MSKNWSRLDLDELQPDMLVRGQGYRKAFHANVKSVVVDSLLHEGMATLALVKKHKEIGEPVEAYWNNHVGAWMVGECKLYTVDYGYLSEWKDNVVKISRAREALRERWKHTEKGQFKEQVRARIQNMERELEFLKKILVFVK